MSIEVLTAQPIAVSYALAEAKILRHIIRTGDMRPTELLTQISTLSDDTNKLDVKSAEVLHSMLNNEDYTEAVAKFGKACGYPGNFQSALLGVISAGTFKDTLRLNILAGGCNCSRANFIGACFGARYGIENEDNIYGIPLDWIAKTTYGCDILEMALQKIV